MKKSLLTICVMGSSLLGATAEAAPGAVGIGAAMLNVRGGFEYNFWSQDYEVNGVSDGKDSSGYMGSISISPTTTIIPNMRAATTDVNGNTLDYSKNDLSMYYNVIKSPYGVLSLGGGLSQSLGTSYFGNETLSLDETSGHFYGAFEFGTKDTYGRLFGQGIFGSGQSDYKIGWKYPFTFGAVGLEIQAGYRAFEIDFQNFGDLNIPVKSSTSGFFAGGTLYLF